MIRLLMGCGLLCVSSSVAAHSCNIDSAGAESAPDVYINRANALRDVKPFIPYHGEGGSDVSICSGVNLGAYTTLLQSGSIDASGTGFGYEISLGAAIKSDGRNSGDRRAISIQIAASRAKSTVKYKNSLGKEVKTVFDYSIFSLPIAYTNIKKPGNSDGFYYQAGINFQYCSGVGGSSNMTKDFHRLFVAPFVSAGVAIVHDIDYLGFRAETVLIGPFVSYTVNNMSSVNGTTINGLNYGIRLWGWLGE